MTDPATVVETLVRRYLQHLEATALALANHRVQVEQTERERDRLLRESAPVLRRDKAATASHLSVSRVEQIIGGEA